MDSNNSVYVRMMVDVLKRKEKILQRIFETDKRTGSNSKTGRC